MPVSLLLSNDNAGAVGVLLLSNLITIPGAIPPEVILVKAICISETEVKNLDLFIQDPLPIEAIHVVFCWIYKVYDV